MVEQFVKNSKIDEAELSKLSNPYKAAKRTRKGRVNFKAFANSFGNEKLAYIGTPIGHIEVAVNSQYWKMLKAKENRSNVMFNIKSTLKDPIFIIKEDDAYKFISSFKKQNGKLFPMLSVCTFNDKGKLVLKTSYQIREFSALMRLATQRGVMVYERDNKTCVNLKLENAWAKFDAVFPHTKESSAEDKVAFAYKAIISLENRLKALKKEILQLKESIIEPNKIEKFQQLKQKDQKLKGNMETVVELITAIKAQDAEEGEGAEVTMRL